MRQIVENNTVETKYVENILQNCEDIEDLEERIFPIIQSQQEAWKKKINEIIESCGMTKTKFAELCDVSRPTVNKWCNGAIPKNREMFLTIGMVAGYDLERMNQLLQRYGQYPELYSKCLEDCVCIYVLEKGYGQESLSKYKYILNKIKENIIRDDNDIQEDIETELVDQKLSSVKSEEELEQFIIENTEVFATTYNKFYAYVKMTIIANYPETADNISSLANSQGWSSSLRQCVSAIRQKKWYPTRNKVISLGLHLGMDRDQIDEMLELAHMEKLYAKNIFESIIIFILIDASLNDIFNTELEMYDPNDLYEHARRIMEACDIPEVDLFLSELSESVLK